jgi:2'-5' RNA ligase
VRLFVAIDFPDPVRASLVALLEGLRPHLPRPVRLSAPERMHLTLAFLGEVDDARQPDLQARLAASVAPHPPLRLQLVDGGRFDGSVLWVGVGGELDGLQRLAASVADAARSSGVEVERRPYRPHVTLARARPATDLRPLAARLEGYRSPAWTASEVLLVRSRIGPDPEHVPVAGWPLTGRPPGQASD